MASGPVESLCAPPGRGFGERIRTVLMLDNPSEVNCASRATGKWWHSFVNDFPYQLILAHRGFFKRGVLGSVFLDALANFMTSPGLYCALLIMLSLLEVFTATNQLIGELNVFQATSMSSMFMLAGAANQPASPPSYHVNAEPQPWWGPA